MAVGLANPTHGWLAVGVAVRSSPECFMVRSLGHQSSASRKARVAAFGLLSQQLTREPTDRESPRAERPAPAGPPHVEVRFAAPDARRSPSEGSYYAVYPAPVSLSGRGGGPRGSQLVAPGGSSERPASERPSEDALRLPCRHCRSRQRGSCCGRLSYDVLDSVAYHAFERPAKADQLGFPRCHAFVQNSGTTQIKGEAHL
jgi:hypothetical protein